MNENTKQTAADAYIAKTAAIRAKIKLVQQMADDHFGHDAGNINWGHVGDLGRIDAALNEIIAA